MGTMTWLEARAGLLMEGLDKIPRALKLISKMH